MVGGLCVAAGGAVVAVYITAGLTLMLGGAIHAAVNGVNAKNNGIEARLAENIGQSIAQIVKDLYMQCEALTMICATLENAAQSGEKLQQLVDAWQSQAPSKVKQ